MKNSWNDYSTTAASNTDVGGINCDEGMSPADVNDCIRELMSHTADVVGGTTALSAINIDGGTIDGATIGGSSAAAGTFTTFTSTGIDDNASSTAITIDSSEDVGIGTTSPGGNLHVQGDAGNSVRLYLTDADATGVGNSLLISKSGTTSFITDRQASSSLYFGTADTERMRIDSSGKVGIGTSSPSQKLTVSGTDARIYLEGADTDIDMDGSGNGQLHLDGNGYAFGIALNSSGANLYTNSASRDLIFGTNETEDMRIDGSNGNVGIGTSSPSSALHVKGSAADPLVVERSTAGNTAIEITDGTDTIYFGMPTGGGFAVDDDSNLASAPFFKIDDATGNVGVGTSTPSRLFEVTQASGDAYMRLRASDTSGGADTVFEMFCADNTQNNFIYFGDADDLNAGVIRYSHGSNYMSFTTNASEAVRINSSGNVGIGTTSPDSILDVEDGTATMILNSTSGSSVMRMQSAGTNKGVIQVGGAGGDSLFFDVVDSSGDMFFRTQSDQTRLTIGSSGSVSVAGAFSKGSGSFRIPHPLAEKAGHDLVHSFIEGPKADLIYRGKVTLVGGSAVVDIDEVSAMTAGTFAALCDDVQCFTSNESGWTAVKGSVEGATLTITAQEADCADTISWMVIGDRKDPHMLETEWTDENGKVILEPLSVESE